MADRIKGKAQIEKQAHALEQLDITYLPTAELRANSYNPNRQSEHDYRLLTASITEDGFTQPVVAIEVTQAMADNDEADGHPVGSIVIVDGEHRWRVASDLGMEKIPVVIVPMTLIQARIATLRHNRARGSEDVELSAAVLRDLESVGALEWAADSLSLDEVEIERLLTDLAVPEQLADPDFSPAWAPGSADQEQAQGGTAEHSATPAAIQAARAAEATAAEAKTEEERQSARKDLDVQRFTFTFVGPEAKIVKAVLGSSPAAKVLELCEAAYKASDEYQAAVAADADLPVEMDPGVRDEETDAEAAVDGTVPPDPE